MYGLFGESIQLPSFHSDFKWLGFFVWWGIVIYSSVQVPSPLPCHPPLMFCYFSGWSSTIWGDMTAGKKGDCCSRVPTPTFSSCLWCWGDRCPPLPQPVQLTHPAENCATIKQDWFSGGLVTCAVSALPKQEGREALCSTWEHSRHQRLLLAKPCSSVAGSGRGSCGVRSLTTGQLSWVLKISFRNVEVGK